MSSHRTRQNLIDAVNRIQYIHGTTNTGAALRMAVSEVFNNGRGDRTDVPNVVVLMTDGGSNNKEDTIAAAIQAKTAYQECVLSSYFIFVSCNLGNFLSL